MQLARQAASQGDVEQAVYHASAAAGLARELGDDTSHAEAQSLLVLHLFTLGRFGAALRHGELALRAWQALQAHERVCETLLRLALSLSELGVHLRALQLARAAWQLAAEHGLHSKAHQAIAMLGGLSARAGAADEGEQLLLQALSRASDAHDVATRTTVINTLLALLLGEWDDAKTQGDEARLAGLAQRLRRHAGPALAQCAEEPHVFRRTVLRGNVAAALAACGQPQDALALQRACAQQAADGGFRVAEMRSRSRLATLLLDAGEVDAAAAEVQRLQTLAADASSAGAELDLLLLNARLATARGDPNLAASLQQQADERRLAHAQHQELLRQQVESEAAQVLQALAPGG